MEKEEYVRDRPTGFSGAATQIEWSPDGKNLAANSSHGLVVWLGDKRVPLKGPSDSFCWSPTGTAIINVSFRGPTIWVYDTTNAQGKFQEVNHPAAARVSRSSDGKQLALIYVKGESAAVVDLNGKIVRAFKPDPGLPYNAEGHYRDPKGGKAEVVYVVQTEKGQETLTPQEFEKRTGWKNDPTKVE